MSITEKIDELLKKYGLVYSSNANFDLLLFLNETAAKKHKSEKHSSEDFKIVMEMIFDYRGYIDIRDFPLFLKTFGLGNPGYEFPEWLFSHSYVRSYVGSGEVKLELEEGYQDGIYEGAPDLLESGNLFFKPIRDEYLLVNVFDSKKAKKIIHTKMKETSIELVERFDQSEIQRVLALELFCIIESEYKKILIQYN